MSHPVNDMIVDQVIDDVANMSDGAGSGELLKAGKGTQFLVGPLADMDRARDVLMELKLDESMSRPGPHG